LGIIIEIDFLKYLGQCCSDRHALAKEKMPIAQVLLARMSLRCHQMIWSGPGAETLEQALSTSCISNIENGTQEQVAWLGTSFRTERLIEQSAVAL